MASSIDTNNGTWLAPLIPNYIYLYHIDTFIVVPSYADSINDSMKSSFAQTPLLSRSAPIYSYQNSGPRTIQVQFDLHRDMMNQLNKDVSNAQLNTQIGEDYVDFMIRATQAAALPSYDVASKMVDPPMAALRLGEDIYIKGVVADTVGVTYMYPIIESKSVLESEAGDPTGASLGRYAWVKISLAITEVDPYQASDALQFGSNRGANSLLEKRFTELTRLG